MYCLWVGMECLPRSIQVGLFYTTTMGDAGIFRIAWVYIEVMFVCDHQKMSLSKHHLCVNCDVDDFPVNIVLK